MSGIPAGARAVVVTASTRASQGVYDDVSGDLLDGALTDLGFEVARVLLPDDRDKLTNAIATAVELKADLVVTTGGTGMSPTDITPEATAPVITRPVPGIAEAIRAYGAASTPYAVMSRGLAGVAGTTFIVNLPGSKGGAKDGIAVLTPLLPHILSQLRGGDH
ncbi:molybdopterin adenylyltransferase [Antricoccus suffuscus]|uniref:Molybdopterin adenylyltransferase n=1 Tax=Antricoccus suffuscus TaxID=1629062 RepID=A0A2T0Z337_9ACTN|nr:MogA/MoaB family molybdenum cofactor biosynthesis protein [Antricoccus suffuscus]PRZ30759.1 molybdopterin adenylyltransferase [Antricoccus suffuscus]